MNAVHPDYWERFVRELTRLPAETGWVEFKPNNSDPDMIGQRISALSNSAALEDQETATNTSLRQRFGVDPRNSATVSRIIKVALEEGVIKPFEEGSGALRGSHFHTPSPP